MVRRQVKRGKTVCVKQTFYQFKRRLKFNEGWRKKRSVKIKMATLISGAQRRDGKKSLDNTTRFGYII